MKKLILIIFIIFIFLGLFSLMQTNKEGIDKLGSKNIEKENVDSYIRENISNLAPNEEVLGGTWYITYLEVNAEQKTVYVTYEDGHIESKGEIKYEYDEKTKEVSIKNFEVLE